jgi:hypothetical protein
LCAPTVGFTHGGGGGGSVQLAVNTLAVLTTIVFVMWTTVLMSAILRHSALENKVFSNPNRNKVSLLPPTGFLGLNQVTTHTLMNNLGLVIVPHLSKQRVSVTRMWSGNVPVTNPIVIDGLSKGLVSSVDKENDPTLLFYITPKISFEE